MKIIYNFSEKVTKFKNSKYLAFFITNNKDKIIKLLTQDKIDEVKNLKEDFFLILEDQEKKKIKIISDKYGRERLFYYLNNEKIVIADIFWNVLDKLEKDEKILDKQNFIESTLFGRPIEHQTIIKNVFVLEPSTEIIIGQDNSIKKNNYWDFKYTNEVTDPDKMINSLDKLLEKSGKKIIEKHGTNITYGIGLSCGLDSRLVIKYMLNAGAKIYPFIIGKKRPKKILLSREHKLYKKLVRHFKLPKGEMIEYDRQSFLDKITNDIKHYPVGPSQAIININNFNTPFDCYLQGVMGGEIFGDFFRREGDIEKINTPQLKKIILKNIGFNQVKSIGNLINNKVVETINKKIDNFLDENKEKNNIEILQKYYFFNNLSRGKYNFFNSFYEKMPFGSFFCDHEILNETLNWDPKYLINGQLQKEFFLKKHPELAKIRDETFYSSIKYRKNYQTYNLRNVFSLANAFLRGKSMNLGGWIKENQKYEKVSKKILESNKEIIMDIYKKNIPEMLNLKHIAPRAYDNTIKYTLIYSLIKKNINPLKEKELKKII